MRSIFLIVISSIMAGCIKEPKATMIVIYAKATCFLKNSSQQTTACIQYRNDYAFSTSDDCNNLEVNYNASDSTYVEQQQTCTSSNLAGICESDDRRIYFYKTLFTAAEASTECYSLGGTPQP